MTTTSNPQDAIENVNRDVALHGGRIGWVIVGGESGARVNRLPVAGQRGRHVARPCALDWARSLMQESREADVAFFVKQLGTNPFDNGEPVRLCDGHGGDWHEWPRDLAVREVPGVDRKWSRP